MAGKQCRGAKRVKRQRDDGLPDLHGQALSPVFRSKVKANLVDPMVEIIRPEAPASHVRAGPQQEERPILDVVGAHGRDLVREPLPDLLARKGAADESRHARVAPQR